MDRDRTIVGVVDRVLAHVRVAHRANHVEVDRVAAETTKLAGVSHLYVLNPCSERFTLRSIGDRVVPPAVQHDVRAVLVQLGRVITLHDYVAAEQRDPSRRRP